MIAFALGAYDLNKPLVIDPQILYATYLGGSSTTTLDAERAQGVAVDAQGSVYIVGTTVSTNFPTKNPAQKVLKGFTNAFITKLDANGQLVYSTYLGGSGFADGAVIKVDDTGAAYVAGSTSSFDFPTVNPIQATFGLRGDGFITKLSPSGSQIVYSTYLGGADTEGVADLAIDAQKNVFVVGNISPALGVPANDFPLVNPIQATHGGGFRDGFMSIIHTSGSTLLFSTYFGGDGEDVFQSINVDPSGQNILLAYFTDSSNFLPSSSSAAPQILVATEPQPAAGVMHLIVRVVGSDIIKVEIQKNGRFTFVEPSVDRRLVGVGLSVILMTSNRTRSFGQPAPLLAGASQPAGGLDVGMDVLDQEFKYHKVNLLRRQRRRHLQ